MKIEDKVMKDETEVVREVRAALSTETKKMLDARKEGKHYFPYGEPECLFCGVFGPAHDEDPTYCNRKGSYEEMRTALNKSVEKLAEVANYLGPFNHKLMFDILTEAITEAHKVLTPL